MRFFKRKPAKTAWETAQAEHAAAWQAKQAAAAPATFYGDGGTIHGTGHLDVEVHEGKVVAVWFRCANLPFVHHEVDARRAADMAGAGDGIQLTGVEFLRPGKDS